MYSIPEELKELLQNDEAKFNIRLHFPNGERTDICNDMIVNGSMKLTESICSQNELKFGLCESPKFECETVGVGNIKDAEIELTYELVFDSYVDGSVYSSDIQKFVYSIPMGKFVVQSCERQADLQHRKIVAYGGGSAIKWELPTYEREKIKNWKGYAYASSLTYTVDIYKIIQSLFNCEKKQEIELSDTNGYQIGIYLRGNKYFSIKFIEKYVSGLDGGNHIVRDYYNTIATYADCILKCAEKLIPDITEEERQSLIEYINKNQAYFSRNHTQTLLSTGVVYVAKGNNFYISNTGGNSYQYYIPYGVRCTYDNKTEEGYYLDDVKVYEVGNDDISYVKTFNIENVNDYLSIDLQKECEAVVELYGKIAKTDKNNILRLIDIKKQFGLMPSEELEPSEELKPLGITGEIINKSMYSECWYDENYTKPYGAVYCQWKDSKNEQNETLVYCNGFGSDSELSEYLTYDISSNEIVKNSVYTTSSITEILNGIADAISGVTYVPTQIKGVALPYVECGDTLQVLTENNDSITTIVLKRTLSGESYITDEFTSK